MNIMICWVSAKPASPAAHHQEWVGWWPHNPGNHWFGQREIGRELKRALTSFKTLHSSKWKSKSSRLVSWISTRKSSFSLKLGRLKFPSQQFSFGLSWRKGLTFHIIVFLLCSSSRKSSVRLNYKREHLWDSNNHLPLSPPADEEGKVWFYNPLCTAVWSSRGQPRPPPWSHKRSIWVNSKKHVNAQLCTFAGS